MRFLSLAYNIRSLRGSELQPGDGVEALPKVRLHGLGVACLCQDLQQLVVGQEVEPDAYARTLREYKATSRKMHLCSRVSVVH